MVCPHLSDRMWTIFNPLNLTGMYDLPTTVLDPRQTVPNKTDVTHVLFVAQIITKRKGTPAWWPIAGDSEPSVQKEPL